MKRAPWLLLLVWFACSEKPQVSEEPEPASAPAETAAAAQPAAAAPVVEAPQASAGSSPVEVPEAPRSEPPAPDVAPEPPPNVEPAPPPLVEVEVPAGTVLELELLTALDSSVNRPGDEIQARTLSPIYVEGDLVLDSGAFVEGRVTEAKASGRVKGRAVLGFTFERLDTPGGRKKIRTSYVAEQAESGAKKDAAVIGGAAGVGAIVGGIIGGKKGAAIGASVGGASGTGVVLGTKGQEVRFSVGSQVNVRLDDPVVILLGT